MKKTHLIGIAALLALAMFSCSLNPVDEPANASNVWVSPDGSRVTIAINGHSLPRELQGTSRALNRPLAIAAHNYFEVVFATGAIGAEVYADASWRLGEPANVVGIVHGVDYGYDDDDWNTGTGAWESTTKGRAILFAGTENDRTLLAVGFLTEVDAPTGGGTTITADTRTVTFRLSALTGGAGLPGGASTFSITAESLEPKIQTVLALDHDRKFPLFRAKESGTSSPVTVTATYTITTTGTAMLDYARKIFVDGSATLIPRYPSFVSNGVIYNLLYGEYEGILNPVITNNAATGMFEPEIAMSFTSPVKSSLDSITFQIPVKAISADYDGRPWFIRPGFGPNRFLLDEGEGGIGGALLLGFGAAQGDNIIVIPGALP